MSQEHAFLKVEEVARLMQLSPKQVISLCKDEENPLPHVRINGRAIRFKRESIDAWFNKQVAV